MKDYSKMCICRECPSFLLCNEGVAFCLKNKSACIKVEKGCICDSCPVHSEKKMFKDYYCTRGSEDKQLNQ